MNNTSLNDFTATFNSINELIEKRHVLRDSHKKNKESTSIPIEIIELTRKIRQVRDDLADAIAKLSEVERKQSLCRSRDWLDARECDNLNWWVRTIIENKPHG